MKLLYSCVCMFVYAVYNNSHYLYVYRLYEEYTLRQVWRVGPIPRALPPTDAQSQFLNSLGDTAVDFDIAPPRVVSTTDDTKDVIHSRINVCVHYYVHKIIAL